MPIFYNTAGPTSTSKNSLNSIAVDYGIRDFLLNKNLKPIYSFLSTSLNGAPRIGEPVLDTMVGDGNVVLPMGLPLETEGILRWEIATLPNTFKDTSSLAGSLTEIDTITKLNPFPSSSWPNGTQGYGSAPDVARFGIMGKTVDMGIRKRATLKNLYVNAAQQVDSADWITLETLPIGQQLLGYTDQYGQLNLGGPSTRAADIVGSVLNGQGLGVAKGGLVTNFDLRASLAGRVLTAGGALNDTKLGVIGGQQLALAIANNAAFNVQQELLGALNVQDNILSLVKNGTLAGFRPNYSITVPSSAFGRVLDTGARILGFELPKSFLDDAGSIFLSDNNLPNIERANNMILNTGKGQVTALIANMNANLIGTTQYDNPSTTPFRTGYAPGYKDNKGQKAINPVTYAFGDTDGVIYNFLTKSGGIIPEISYNRSAMITQYGFTAPEDNIGAANPYANSTIKTPTQSWGSNNGSALNSHSSPTGDGNIVPIFVAADKKKSLLAKTQELFNDIGMKNIVSAFGDISTSIVPSQIQTAVVGGGISKGNAVMSSNMYDVNGIYDATKTGATNTYCRSWTTFKRYDTVQNLVRSAGLNKTVPYRFQTNGSILDEFGFPQIAPYSTDNPEDPKKYMFSIENLAWAGGPSDNLLPCEVGPGDLMSGLKGRIMWFPPYNIKINESSNVSWEANQFIGRGESVYTYNNTERSGTLSFSIIVDHPSYINAFRGSKGPDDHYVASFFAGCIDPTSKFADKLTVSEVSSIAAANAVKPQERVITPETPPANFNFFYPNDFGDVIRTLAPINGQVYENGLSGTTKIDYNGTYVSGASIGTFAGGGTSSTSWNDNYNYGLNGWRSESKVGDQTYSGITDPAYIPALKTYLETKCPHCTVTVQSFASPQGSATANAELAEARTQSMLAYLRANLFSGKKEDYITARLKTKPSRALSTTESTCVVAPAGAPKAPIDTPACKFDRRTSITFEFVPALAADDIAPPEPMEAPAQQRVNTKITNRFYTECNYFEQLTDKDSFVFDKFRDKIKYFHPAFHSTTPEGLNSRLTFLQQCTRQGPTLDRLGANNLAFGRPPVCILRIGDFFNTKIIMDSISIDYDPIVWDLNPEGVGVQPMIANVNISFKFIGGSTLMGPINKLQNALSFNYYANAQVYDPRADYIAKTSDLRPPRVGQTQDEAREAEKSITASFDANYVLVRGITDLKGGIERGKPIADASNSPGIDQVKANEQATGAKTPEQSSDTPVADDLSRIKLYRVDLLTGGDITTFFSVDGVGTLNKDQNFRVVVTDNKNYSREVGVGTIPTTAGGTSLNFTYSTLGLEDGITYTVIASFGNTKKYDRFTFYND